jgi:hypothetical protein
MTSIRQLRDLSAFKARDLLAASVAWLCHELRLCGCLDCHDRLHRLGRQRHDDDWLLVVCTLLTWGFLYLLIVWAPLSSWTMLYGENLSYHSYEFS